MGWVMWCSAPWLAALTWTDARWRRLPNVLTLPGAALVVAGCVAAGHGVGAVFGGLALSGCYAITFLLAPQSIGAGDVKLALGTGALTGAAGLADWQFAAFTAPLASALWVLATWAVARVSGVRPRQSVPHGIAMCAATALALTSGAGG